MNMGVKAVRIDYGAKTLWVASEAMDLALSEPDPVLRDIKEQFAQFAIQRFPREKGFKVRYYSGYCHCPPLKGAISAIDCHCPVKETLLL